MRVLIISGVGIEFPLGAGALFGEIVGMRLAHCRDDRPLALPRISPIGRRGSRQDYRRVGNPRLRTVDFAIP
jgi:hypothetical protein